jgi:hypothetical protein
MQSDILLALAFLPFHGLGDGRLDDAQHHARHEGIIGRRQPATPPR